MKKLSYKFTEKETKILEVLEILHSRGGVLSAEIEYMLMLYFNNNDKIVNYIINQWENNRG